MPERGDASERRRAPTAKQQLRVWGHSTALRKADALCALGTDGETSADPSLVSTTLSGEKVGRCRQKMEMR